MIRKLDGYVPRALAQLLAPLADDGGHLSARVVRRGRAKPSPGRPPLYGASMAIEGDMSAIHNGVRSGLEPAIAHAVVMAAEETAAAHPYRRAAGALRSNPSGGR